MKYLLITLIVQDGENRHDHRILHVTKGQDIQLAAQWYAAHFYSTNGEEIERVNDWWEFQAGCIAVEMYSVIELSEFEYKLMQRIFDGDKKPQNYFEIVQAGYNAGLEREEIQIHCGENGNMLIAKTPEGFVVDVYDQDDLAETMTVWEEDLETPEEDTKGELGRNILNPLKKKSRHTLKNGDRNKVKLLPTWVILQVTVNQMNS